MKAISSIAILIISIISTDLTAASYCGELQAAGAGPRGDYTNSEHKKTLQIVEEHHFTPNIESLRYGNSGTLGGELSYTLMMFPNHHRALSAFGKLSLRDKTLKPVGAKYSVECFFDRAIRFKPSDGVVRMIYGNYLLKAGQTDKAVEQLKEAVYLQPENPNINYNLGLLYAQKKDYEQSKIYAKKAYELGFPLPGLKNKLMEAGKWDD
jgi:tetratricopeptide (TPR) repeat protein